MPLLRKLFLERSEVHERVTKNRDRNAKETIACNVDPFLFMLGEVISSRSRQKVRLVSDSRGGTQASARISRDIIHIERRTSHRGLHGDNDIHTVTSQELGRVAWKSFSLETSD